MASEEHSQEPCTACGWTQERQQQCLYKSHVNICYERSSRAVWALGSQYVVKDRKNNPPDLEPENTEFLRRVTTIPVPAVIAAWDEEDDTSMRVIKRIDGEPLSKAWPGLTQLEKREIAKEAAAYLAQLRHLQSPRLQCLGKTGYLYDAFLFPAKGYDDPSGPFDSDDELWAEMAKCLIGLPDKVCRVLRRRMPPATPYTFTHGDLSHGNIMAKDGKVTGIIDWERSGYFPRWWEFVGTLPAEDEDDREWKALLREYIEPHREAADFWRAFFYLSRYPDVNETGQAYLEELEAEDE